MYEHCSIELNKAYTEKAEPIQILPDKTPSISITPSHTIAYNLL